MLAQDKESLDSDTSHEEKCLAFFEDVPNLIEHQTSLSSLRCRVSPGPLIPPESRTLRYNQQHMINYFSHN
ncbi:hypothetical protein [Falsibacillus albus]|uniref:Uncharacterized protein n=1 Tax=Falsibacillus albus TaxID=2478915 RepID=A0A3L7K4Y8_9BACI|nr:hypothetical protein [Falsibacillus albus]RLQ97324.1 hypothetical protein D9X91_04025 [Falsibacillus albus]